MKQGLAIAVKEYMNYLKLILIFLILESTCFAYPLDTHVHYKPYDYYHEHDGAQLFLSQNKFKTALLISPSFHINPLIEKIDPQYFWMKDLTQREILDKQTIQIVQKNPDRFLGLCGYNINWPDAEIYLKRCLSQQGMVGIKIHTENTQSRLQDPAVLSKFQNLFASIENSHPVVLWHIASGLNFSRTNRLDFASEFKKEAAVLTQLIRRFQKITFVMAHALYINEGLQAIKDIEQQDGRLNNLYLEISTRWQNIALDFDDLTVTDWRKFGFERIIFGSDLGFISIQEFNSFTETLEKSEKFTAIEKYQILEQGPENLLKHIVDVYKKQTR